MKRFQVVFLFVFLISCSSNQTISSTATHNILQTPSPYPTQTAISPTQTLTPTSTFTPTFTSPATWTPLPTLSANEGMKTLQSWLQGADDCLLPCWGGITPGKTSWQEAKQIIESLSGYATINIDENLDCKFSKCHGIGWSLFPNTLADGGFYSAVPNNKVHLINITIQDARLQKTNLLKYMNLEYILSQYGRPAILLFSTEPDLPGDIFLELTFVYPEKHFVIRYSKYATLLNDEVVSCGKDSYIKLIILDNPEQLISLTTIANAAETKDLHVDVWHKTVEEATGITIDKFYQIYSKTNAPCISTPTKIWLQ
ncbi:MAG: hypothetical protein ABI904_20125 [Chloroflexota bacterium]